MKSLPPTGLNMDRKVVFGLTLIALAVVITYGNTLYGQFIHDDNAEILQNPFVRDFSYLPEIFSKPAWGFGSEGPYQLMSSYYRPIQYLSYAILYHIFGREPWGFHLFKLLSHLIVCGLVFGILLRSRRDYFLALFSALLFAVHPGNTEAVTWISGITDTNCVLFFLICFWIFLRDRNEPSLTRIVSLSLLFLVGMLSKESMVMFIVVIFAYDMLEDGRIPSFSRQFRLYFPLLGMFGFYLILRFHAIGGFTFQQQIRYGFLTPFQVFLNQLMLLSRYLALFFFPRSLNAHHLFDPILSPLDRAFGLALLILTICLTGVLLLAERLERENRKVFLLGITWFVLTLLPVLLFLKRIGENLFAERYFYLPSIGLCLSFSVALLWFRQRYRKVVTVAFGFLLVGLSVRSFVRNRVWQNEQIFYETTAKASPNAAVILNGLGTVYARQGRYQDAMKIYESSYAARPTVPALKNLGFIYSTVGRKEDALAVYRKAMDLDPMDSGTYSALGDVFVSLGRYEEAIANFQKALALYPESTVALFKYANACTAVKRYDDAITALKKIIAVSPGETSRAYKMLAEVYEATNQPKLAEEANWKASVGPVKLIR